MKENITEDAYIHHVALGGLKAALSALRDVDLLDDSAIDCDIQKAKSLLSSAVRQLFERGSEKYEIGE